jgi:RNA polymerase sigma-70 factor, ECF subfamily
MFNQNKSTMRTNTKINKAKLMKGAWKLFKNQNVKTDEAFSLCLKKAWAVYKVYDFEEVYKRYYAGLINYVKLNVTDPMDIEEIVNDAFLKVDESIVDYDITIGNIGSWLYKITKNVIIDRYRKNRKHSANVSMSEYTDENGRETLQIADDVTTDDVIESNEKSEQIKTIINETLTAKQRRIAELYFLKEYSYKEIEAEMQISMSDVKVTIRRTRIALQNAMMKANLY